MIATKDVAPDPIEMQDELDSLPELVRRAEGELELADERREIAQAIYDEAAREVAAAMAAGTHAYGEEWVPRSGGQLQADADRQRDARAAFDQADQELAAALVARTEAARVRGGLLMRRAQLESLLASAEREHARHVEPAAPGGRDLLAAIRRRLFGDGPETAR